MRAPELLLTPEMARRAERRIARQVESERQRKAYAERRAAECRAARLRFTGEQA